MEDVERLFGESVIAWMENKGYSSEAEYLRVIRNWRHASDERGLTDEQRSSFNKEFLNYMMILCLGTKMRVCEISAY